MKTLFTPRLQRVMRGRNEPLIRPPLVRTIGPALGYDLEYGASMQPRANPVFNDTWIIGATGGASKVIPQGIDYSRTPCCTASGPMSGVSEAAPLLFGVIGVPLVLLGLIYFLGGKKAAKDEL